MGERAERLKHILEISGDSSSVQTQSYDTSQTLPRKLSHSDTVSSHSYTRLKNDSISSPPVRNGKPFDYNARQSTITSAVSGVAEKKKEEPSETYNWRENLVKMRQQIKAVNDLPTIDVPEPIKNHKYRGSFSTPDLSQFSDKPRWSCESSWEIRAKYRSVRTSELCQGQLIKKSGYSWREKVPEIQKPLKFSEVRSNAVTDAAFIGSSYVRDKEQNFNSSDQKLNEKSKAQIMTKIYRIDSSVDIMKLVIKDNINPHFTQETQYVRLAHNKDGTQADKVLLERLWQMLNFFNFCWQLKLCHPGFDLSRDVAKIIAAAKIMETIMEVDEIPDLEDVKKTEDPAGDIKSKMTGAIAGLQLVKKKAPEKAPMKNDSKVSAGGAAGDWRSEIKKRERAKQQEKLNAMPLGMPDYREPEKPQIVDWREKLKKEAENDNPMNKWKKFDSGVKKTVRPPPQKPKPKPSKSPKEDPCTCNVGNCKIHSKFAFTSLKSTAKKNTTATTTDQNNNKTDEPMKRRTSVRKRQQEGQSSLKRSDSNQSLASSKQTELKKVKMESRAGSRASSAAPEDTEMVEVIKIINFVAIKMTMKASDVKKTDNCTIVSPPPPLPSHPPPPVPKDYSPSQQSCSQKSSSKSLTPSPPRDPPPPRKATPPPPPKTPTPPPPPPKLPSPVKEEIKPVEKPNPERTPSPVYQRKFFPNPEPSEPYKPKIWDYTPNTVKLKRTKEYYVEEPVIRRQFSADLEVAPVKFSSNQDNCVKKALFVGNAYLGGDNISEFKVILF